MWKFGLTFLLGFLLVGCSASEPVTVATTIAPEVTIEISNHTEHPIALLGTSNIGATMNVGGSPVVNRLKLEEAVIEPGATFSHSWGDISEAIAISGYVEVEIQGEVVRLNATF